MCFTVVTEGSLGLTWGHRRAEEYMADYLLKGKIRLDQLQHTKIPGTSILGYYLPPEVPEPLFSSVATNPPSCRPLDVRVDLPGRGQIIPQKLWTPYTATNRQNYVTNAMLHLPIYFIGDGGNLGVSYAQVADEAPTNPLVGGEEETFDFGKFSVKLRVCLWPYKPKDLTIHLGKKPVSRRTLAQKVFGCLKDIFENPPELDIMHNKYADWKIGSEGIELRNILLVGVAQVSSGTFVPIIQLAKSDFPRWLPGMDEMFASFGDIELKGVPCDSQIVVE